LRQPSFPPFDKNRNCGKPEQQGECGGTLYDPASWHPVMA
jgi:hypothetical protein